jgi:hypothetical protein
MCSGGGVYVATKREYYANVMTHAVISSAPDDCMPDITGVHTAGHMGHDISTTAPARIDVQRTDRVLAVRRRRTNSVHRQHSTPSGTIDIGIRTQRLGVSWMRAQRTHFAIPSRLVRTLHFADRMIIFAFIAASYTPWLHLRLSLTTGTVLLACMWAVAVVGSAFQLLARDQYPIMELVFYVAVGVVPAPFAVMLSVSKCVCE